MLRARPDLEVVPFRGNVDTRLRKLAEGVADATLLAVAGLNRLGRTGEITSYLDPELFPPAPAQGAIGLEIRADDGRTAEIIKVLDHSETTLAVRAERALLGALDGSCRTAIGALSRIEGDTLTLQAEMLSPDGRLAFFGTLSGSIGEPERIGHELGQILRDKAGSDFFKLETAARLFALDIDALVEPLLTAETLTTTLPPADGFAALAATSANALRALHDRGELPRFLKLPLYAVGDRTAELAQHFGFARV
eukprot:gene54947-73403_t